MLIAGERVQAPGCCMCSCHYIWVLDENDFSGTIAANLSKLTTLRDLYVWQAALMESFVLIFAPWLLLHLECSTRPRWTLEQ
eukprot:2976015-Pleurochrysis_carterae.AAC.1